MPRHYDDRRGVRGSVVRRFVSTHRELMCSQHDATSTRNVADPRAASIDRVNLPCPWCFRLSGLKNVRTPAAVRASYTARAALASGVSRPPRPECLNEIKAS